MGIQTSLDELRAATRIVEGMRLADELAFESTRDPGVRTIRVLRGALLDADQLVAIAAVHALGKIGDDEASRAVARLLSDDRPFMREHAAWVLGSGLPRADAVARLVGMTRVGGFGGMLAQRTLEQWSSGAPEQVAVGLEAALLGVTEPEARARVVETLGLVRHAVAVRPLLELAGDTGEDGLVRGAAVAALGQRPGDGAVVGLLDGLAAGDDELADVARLALVDIEAAASWRREPARPGLSVAQLFLHADIDAGLTAAGAGDNGGIATLLVRLGDALVAPDLLTRPVDRVITISRGSVVEAVADLGALDGSGHHYGRVPLRREPVPMAAAWSLRVSARRGIRRVLRAAGGLDLLHLRMADVGSLAAADVASELDIPTVFTVAPDPHAVIQSLDLAGRLTRQNFGEVDAAEHFWFRARLVQRLAANAAHTVLFPRPALRRDMRELVGIDVMAHPERHTIVPEGVDLVVVDRAVAEAEAYAAGGEPTDALAELRALVDGLPSERRPLPLIVSVGRLHRVKGVATLVQAWASGGLRDRANLLVVGGDLEHPTADEREQLDLIDAAVPATEREAAGLLLPGHRPNDVVARWVAAARTGLPGRSSPRGIYVCASLKEEFGIALLEAMGSGLVVVAPDGGGPATYVEEGDTGFLTATWHVDRLRTAIGSALDASLAETDDRRAGRSRSTVAQSFTIERMAGTLGDLYRRVAADEVANRSALVGPG
ncbi:glycosyltransferase [Cellulomonas sp. Leaf334]|uniref:glycosyltransferase n=1 Tax=Cellulomonas sp. Leaf334 TaxID=1736339 RepID=UPI0006F60364|nr:glycosyltransferase [Cellulomonas sp. Leaf334]KQR16792.1 sucrose synthase (sucrose-UDP glucosyltransferase) [Cellulomonas sp. Leaf334]